VHTNAPLAVTLLLTSILMDRSESTILLPLLSF